MKTLRFVCLAGLLTSSLPALTIIDSTSFFNPDFRARRDGVTSGLLALTVNNTPFTPPAQNNLTNTWTHSAGGFAQIRTDVTAVVVIANIDAQLAAYTQTFGDALTFGREITATATLLGIPVAGQNGPLNTAINAVAGASVLYNWESDASISDLTIVADQLYEVSFTVSTGAGLPVNVLSSSTFGITNPSITGASNESAQLLNLLDVVTLGPSADTGIFTFQFKSTQALSQLDFNFAATTGVGVSLLGGTAGIQNVLTFSGFEVNSIPEPQVWLLSCVFISFLANRRRR
ncbi:MAG: hypothetical protein H7Y36_03870 [Armatimonadetes bacterium]|nr:hypothetical protein [Akkermansiaceae bacterium]